MIQWFSVQRKKYCFFFIYISLFQVFFVSFQLWLYSDLMRESIYYLYSFFFGWLLFHLLFLKVCCQQVGVSLLLPAFFISSSDKHCVNRMKIFPFLLGLVMSRHRNFYPREEMRRHSYVDVWYIPNPGDNY